MNLLAKGAPGGALPTGFTFVGGPTGALGLKPYDGGCPDADPPVLALPRGLLLVACSAGGAFGLKPCDGGLELEPAQNMLTYDFDCLRHIISNDTYFHVLV